MSNEVVASVVKLKTEELRALVTSVDETLATEVNVHPSEPFQKKFGILDLRKIRSKSRNRGTTIR